MRRLLRQIKSELKTAKHCAIYQEELSRVWPDDRNQRNQKSRRFAEQHGFRLRLYRDGLCAIFDTAPERERQNSRLSYGTTLEPTVLVPNRSGEPAALSEAARQAKADKDSARLGNAAA